MKPLASSLLACGAILLASSALAQGNGEFPVGACGQISYAPNGDALSYCEMENPGDAPIARVKARVTYQHPAQAEPLSSHVVEFTVPGGVPGRAANSVPFPHRPGADLPPSPKFQTIVEVMEAWDYQGLPVRAGMAHFDATPMQPKTAEVSRRSVTQATTAAAPARKSSHVSALQNAPLTPKAETIGKTHRANITKLSETERQVLAQQVRGCWNVNARSDIADVSLMVQFSLDEDGQLIGDLETIQSSDADERTVWDAYMAARRAVLRCQGDGFPIAGPAENIRMLFVDGNSVEVL